MLELTKSIKIILPILPVAISILFFAMLYNFSSGMIKDRYELVKARISGSMSEYMRNIKWDSFNYYYIQKMLDSTGTTFYSKGTVTPMSFMLVRVLLFVLGLIIGTILLGLIGGIIIGGTVFCMPVLLMKSRDKKDNKKMLRDIMNMYDVIKIQTEAGVYISQILIEAYMVVRNERLQNALLELTGKIKETDDIEIALEVFKRRFNNEHINNLTAAIMQSVRNGNSVRMMEDIRNYMVTLQKSYNKEIEESVKRRGIIISIAIFGGIMGLLAYAALFDVMKSVSGLGL